MRGRLPGPGGREVDGRVAGVVFAGLGGEVCDQIEGRDGALDASTIDRIREILAGVLRCGTLGQRKAVMEIHIAEIRLDNDRLIPVYRIPPDTFAHRAKFVGRTMHHANHPTVIPGNPLPGRLASSRDKRTAL